MSNDIKDASEKTSEKLETSEKKSETQKQDSSEKKNEKFDTTSEKKTVLITSQASVPHSTQQGLKTPESNHSATIPILKKTSQAVTPPAVPPASGALQCKHTIYEVDSIPALKGHIVPINEKVQVLKRMKFHDEINVKQYFEDTEDVVGFKMSNTYAVTVPNRFSFDPQEQSVLYIIGEKISCEMSWFKTSSRALHFYIFSPEGDVIGFMTRPCRPCFCMTNICPCAARNSFEVTLADGRLLGRVQKNCKFFSGKFSIFDAEGNLVFEAEGATLGHVFPCWLIQSAAWKVLRTKDDAEEKEKPLMVEGPDDVAAEMPDLRSVAYIAMPRTPACIENGYTLTMRRFIDVKYKMLLISLIILIDFQHFKRCSGICHCLTFLFWVTVILGSAIFTFYVFVVKDKM